MRIALSLLDQAWENKKENLAECNKLAKISSQNKADLIIFPEMTLTGFTLNTIEISENVNAPTSIPKFSSMAVTNDIAIVAGMVLDNNNLFHNTAVAFGENGKILTQYEKIHPFSFAGEDKYISGGTNLSVFELNNIRFGLTICYDLRFPLLWAALAGKCDCIINIANWPAKRLEHWYTLLQARAIENQVYVIGVNRVGTDGNGLAYVKSSRAYGPDGSTINPIIVDDNVNIIEIDKSIVKNHQNEFPLRRDRRNTLYHKLLNTETE